MNDKFKRLFEEFQFQNGASLKNRIIMAPMTNFSSNEDGSVSDAEAKEVWKIPECVW